MKIWYSRLARSKESLHWPEIKNEHPHEPASSGALVIRQLNYIENGGKRQMAMYRTCPLCGANLDPGELCDCQDGEESDGEEPDSEQCDLRRSGTRKRYSSGRESGISVCAGEMLTRYITGTARV